MRQTPDLFHAIRQRIGGRRDESLPSPPSIPVGDWDAGGPRGATFWGSGLRLDSTWHGKVNIVPENAGHKWGHSGFRRWRRVSWRVPRCVTWGMFEPSTSFMPWNGSRVGPALLPAGGISTIDLSRGRIENRQERRKVFRNRRPDDIEIHVEVRVDQTVPH